ncbi:MAG: hypothetical protein NZ108_05750 [Bacteroidia bacterium]|nr:hypothetical protein [Bacteroidia bacterium]
MSDLDLEKTWKKLDSEKFSAEPIEDWSPKKDFLGNPISGLPMEELKRSFLIQTGIAILAVISFLVGSFFTKDLILQILLWFLSICSLLNIGFYLRLIRNLTKTQLMNRSLREVLQTHCLYIRKMLKYQEVIAIFLYPIFAATGFFVGMSSQTTVWQAIHQSQNLILLSILLPLLTLLGYFSSRWLNRHSYEKYLDELEDKLKELQTD